MDRPVPESLLDDEEQNDDDKKSPQRSGKGERDCGSVEDRRQLRKDLKCKNFSWFLDNVYPELQVRDKNLN